MLDSTEFTYKAFQDNRAKNRPGFIEGTSGPLYLATHKASGAKYLVKHTYRHNAANEFVACWLADKLGVPAPTAYLLTPNNAFSSKYAVAISFIDGLSGFDKKNVPGSMTDDLIGQFALNSLIDTSDIMQLSTAGKHIYSYDFSEAFNISDEYLLKVYLFNEDLGIEMTRQRLASFRGYLRRIDFDVPELAAEFNLDSAKQKEGMIAVAKRALKITEDDILSMSDEMPKVYPLGYVVYYEECIHSIQERVREVIQP